MTIYDFGCVPPAEIWGAFIPCLVGALAVVVVMAGFAALGALLHRRADFQAADPVGGWAIAAIVLTLTAIFFRHGVPAAALALGTAMLAAIFYQARRGYFTSSAFWVLALFPGLIVLFAINVAGIAKWDDFSHWVPNALYLFVQNGIPAHDMLPPTSVWPSYPYALPFVTYLASHLAGGFLMQGGAMTNFLLLLVFAAMLTEIHRSRAAKTDFRAVGVMGIALFLVTLANPAFNASFTITNQGDTAIAVLTGILVLLLARLIEALRGKDHAGARLIGLQAALACALFVLIKQVAIVLLALLAGAFLIAAAKNKILGPALRYLPPLLIPALILHGLWQYDVDTQMANGGFGIKPLAAWRFDLAGSILGAIAHEMMRKSGLFILLVALIGTGTVALFRKPSRVGTFALIAAPVCGGYLIFLFVSYLGSNFVDAEATRAASFYRYATHLGLLGIAFVWLAVPEIGRRIKVKMPALPFDPAQAARIGTVSLLLLPLALAINGAWLVPKPGAEVCAVRALGHKIAAALPADVHHLAVLDPEGQGLARYIVNLELELAGAQTGRVILADRGADHLDAAALAAQLQEAQSTPNTDAILILRSSTPELLLREGMVWKTRTF